MRSSVYKIKDMGVKIGPENAEVAIVRLMLGVLNRGFT
jgi:hypothetical protein